MKVMLEEIARKREEEAQAQLEGELRLKDGGGRTSEPPPDSSVPPCGTPPDGRPPQ
jgi:hypothetical protein